MRTLLALGLLAVGTLSGADIPRKPNVIVVLADDVGLPRIGCYGGAPFRTPHIDRLAATGLRFERCYSMPLCGPSRGALLTGKYPFRTGYLGNNSSTIAPDRHPTVANVLQKAGYATCAIGKLGQSAPEDDVRAPRALGFDEYMLWMGRNTPDRYWNPRYCRNGEFVQGGPDQYGPDVTHDFLVDFMLRNLERPFFVYYSAVLAHTPFMRTPESAPDTKDRGQLLTDMVHYLDTLMGRLAADLDRLGLRDNTIIIFTSDNGPYGDPTGTVHGKAVAGVKGETTEGGVREPLIVNCPAMVPGGRVCADLTDFTDIFPTVLELSGVTPPTDLKLDGRSFAPQALGSSGKPRDWVYAQLANDYFIADRRHKLYGDGRLTDITDSPGPETPVKDGDEAGIDARARLSAALSKLRDGVPTAVKTAPKSSRPKPVPSKQAPVASEALLADLRLLAERKVIDDVGRWTGRSDLEGAHVAEMLIKAAGQFAPTSGTEEAIAILQREGVIISTPYWKEHAKAGMTCDATSVARLIHKAADRLRSR